MLDAKVYLLAFTYEYLGDHDLLKVRTGAEKYLLLGALNLVECVAFLGPTTHSSRSRLPGPVNAEWLDAYAQTSNLSNFGSQGVSLVVRVR